MRKVLIIGFRGLLGQELAGVFSRAILWDKKEVDITDKNKLNAMLSKVKPDVVINAAAYNAVDNCETTDGFKLAKKINDDAVGYLADFCSKNNALLIHYSTNYVFSGNKKEGYNENDVPAPISKYGYSKLMGEKKITAKKNLKYYLIRTSKLFGVRGKSEFAKENFFDIMLKLANEKKDIKAVDDELSNFTYAPDLAQATKVLLEQNYEYGVYHIVNENPATWYHGARKLFDILKLGVKLIAAGSDEFSRPAKRPRHDILINTKFPKLRNYEDALHEFLKLKSL
ncbi:dTDP-4-dehydrorhamnose reductase [Candidatus Falkowbacteria bacterium CG10_big_fil_rev_8_21_14_0_10_37_6]|uniref:dTDP-4-dehydrorhamnose reductase n=1 Tax=Candidatus Falkowbacteria bacterium CG10_big_fil_rev_8_21_14_0_10_37_6 TaxID=1974563 RepID=A0A2H0V6Y7_9BACT|nr:MAG: dTDP-4-dehydrorhamnose reductase [Candidatus Falkowbacteria bacterium CG10_big_fil_rev_8_21_14_0_10_37_6]